jgi:hypothetical protein
MPPVAENAGDQPRLPVYGRHLSSPASELVTPL